MARKAQPGKSGAAFKRCVKAVSKRPGVYSPRGVCATAGRKKYGKATFQKMAAKGKRKENLSYRKVKKFQQQFLGRTPTAMRRGKTTAKGYTKPLRGNPAEAAAEAFEKFHGFQSDELITVKERVHRHKHLATAGELVGLLVKPRAGGARRKLHTPGAYLAFNEKMNQLFIKGGDQFMSDAELKKWGVNPPHELETLGKLVAVGYYTEKKHLGKDGGEAIYDHTFRTTNEHGRHITVVIARFPDLIYRVMDQQLEISGGSYTIKAEGIDK